MLVVLPDGDWPRAGLPQGVSGVWVLDFVQEKISQHESWEILRGCLLKLGTQEGLRVAEATGESWAGLLWLHRNIIGEK